MCCSVLFARNISVVTASLSAKIQDHGLVKTYQSRPFTITLATFIKLYISACNANVVFYNCVSYKRTVFVLMGVYSFFVRKKVFVKVISGPPFWNQFVRSLKYSFVKSTPTLLLMAFCMR